MSHSVETSTWQYTTDRHPCPRWDLNPRFQTARPLKSVGCQAKPKF